MAAGNEAAPASRPAPPHGVTNPQPFDDDDFANDAAAGFPELEADEADAEPLDAADDGPEVDPAPRRSKALPRCANRKCGKPFIPSHRGERYCGSCGADVRTAVPKSESWWLTATSREDFTRRQAEHEDAMRNSKMKFKVANRILGEKTVS